MTLGQDTQALAPWGPWNPLTMEFIAISVIVNCYELRGFTDFRSGYTAFHSLGSFGPSNWGVYCYFSH